MSRRRSFAGRSFSLQTRALCHPVNLVSRLLPSAFISCSWRVEHGEPPTEEAVWDLYRLEQKNIAASTQRLERAEAENLGEAPIPPSMVSEPQDTRVSLAGILH